MDTCRMARTREAIGGDVRATRMASRAAAFQSVTTSANAGDPSTIIKDAAVSIFTCLMACPPASTALRYQLRGYCWHRVKPVHDTPHETLRSQRAIGFLGRRTAHELVMSRTLCQGIVLRPSYRVPSSPRPRARTHTRKARGLINSIAPIPVRGDE